MVLNAAIPLPWQQAHWERLRQARQRERLPHALLISGQKGLGKSAFAMALARALLCRETDDSGRACGRCRACQLTAAGTHPDLRLVAPEEGSSQIRIDAVREILDHSVLSVGERRRRVFILDPAEALGGPAANALLKTLEEPLAGIHMLLVSAHPERLPVTIRSRCQPLRFLPPSPEQGTRWLVEQGQGMAPERARELLRIAGGAPLAALEAAEKDMDGQYLELARQFMELAEGGRDPLSLAEHWLGAAELEQLLGYLAAWLLDVIREQLNPGGEGMHTGSRNGPDLRSVYGLLDNLFEIQRNLNHNLNAQLALEELLLEWHRIAGGAR